MKANHHTAEQIIKILEQAEKGDQTVSAVCRTHGIAEATLYRSRNVYSGMSIPEAQRLKEHLEKNMILAERRDAVHALVVRVVRAWLVQRHI